MANASDEFTAYVRVRKEGAVWTARLCDRYGKVDEDDIEHEFAGNFLCSAPTRKWVADNAPAIVKVLNRSWRNVVVLFAETANPWKVAE